MTLATRRSLGPGPQRRLRRVPLIMLLPVVLGAIGGCQKGAAGATSRPTGRKECEGPIASSPIAHQPLALRRYRVLKQVERRGVGFALYGSLEYVPEVLFPRGKSDKVYIYSPSENQISCFASTGSAAKLLYSVKLKMVWFRPPKQTFPVRSMLDYIGTMGYGHHRDRTVESGQPRTFSFTLSGHISQTARRDLSSRQELVLYWYQAPVDALFVGCLSLTAAESDLQHNFQHYQAFQVSEDRDQWFETYGLPVADCELSAKSKQRSQTSTGESVTTSVGFSSRRELLAWWSRIDGKPAYHLPVSPVAGGAPRTIFTDRLASYRKGTGCGPGVYVPKEGLEAEVVTGLQELLASSAMGTLVR